MPDVADLYPQLAALSFDQLNMRRAQLIGDKKTFQELSNDELRELSCVANLLRRKSSGPPKEDKKVPKIKSIMDLNV